MGLYRLEYLYMYISRHISIGADKFMSGNGS